MFEGFVCSLLRKYLGGYFHGVYSENLSLGLSKGCLELKDLQLKAEALSQFELPAQVVAGYIGRLAVTVQWWSCAVEVSVEDVYLISGPTSDTTENTTYNHTGRCNNPVSGHSADSRPSFLRRFSRALFNALQEAFRNLFIGNLEVSVHRVHLRHEDEKSAPDKPWVFGVMVNEVTVGNGQHQQLQQQQQEEQHLSQQKSGGLWINKMVCTDGLSAYWTLPSTGMLGKYPETSSWKDAMRDYLVTPNTNAEGLVFSAVSSKATWNLCLNQTVTSLATSTQSTIEVDTIDIKVNWQQVMSMNQWYRDRATMNSSAVMDPSQTSSALLETQPNGANVSNAETGFEHPKHESSHVVKMSVASCSVSLIPGTGEQLTATLSHLTAGLEYRPRDTDNNRYTTIESRIHERDIGNPTHQTQDASTTAADTLKVKVNVSKLRVGLTQRHQHFAEVSIQGLEGTTCCEDGGFVAEASLTHMTLEDLTDTRYPRILTIEDDRDLYLKFTRVHPRPIIRREVSSTTAAGDLTPLSTLNLHITHVNFVFLYKFVTEVTSFVQLFTGSSMQDQRLSGIDKVEDLQQTPSLSISVELGTWCLHVPQTSRSDELLLVELGHVRMSNSPRGSATSNSARQGAGTGGTADWVLRWDMESVRVSRGRLTQTHTIENIHTMSEPTSLTLDVAQFQSGLDYDINGKLDVPQVSVTRADLKRVMAVLRQNVAEPSLLVDPPVPDYVLTVSYRVTLTGAHLTLLGAEDGSAQAEESESDPFCQLDAERIEIDGWWRSDNSQKVKVILQSLLVDDLRPSSELAVKRIILPSQLNCYQTTIEQPMVVFEYELTKDGDQNNNLELEQMRVNLCWSYLLAVQDFFFSSLWPTNQPDQRRNSVNKTYMSNIGNKPGIDYSIVDTDITKVTIARQAEIVIFTDPKDPQSEELVIKADVSYKDYTDGEAQQVEYKISQMCVGCRPHNMVTTDFRVLSPCDVEVSYSVDPVSGEVWGVRAPDPLELRLSASSMATLLRACNLMGGQPKEDTPTIQLTEQGNLWDVTPIEVDEWLEEDKDDALWEEYPINYRGPAKLTYEVDLKNVGIIFKLDNEYVHQERLRLWAAVEGSVLDIWEPQRRCNAKVALEASCFLEQQGTWEPLLDPWELVVKTVDAYSSRIGCGQKDFEADRQEALEEEMYNLLTEARSGARDRPLLRGNDTMKGKGRPAWVTDTDEGVCYDDVVDGVEDDIQEEETAMCSYVVIHSKDDLKVTLTKESMGVVRETIESITMSPAERAKVATDMPAFEIYNQLGLRTEVCLTEQLAMREEHLHEVTLVTTPLQPVTNGSSVQGSHCNGKDKYHSIDTSDRRNGLTDTDSNKAKLNIKIEGFNQLNGLSYNKATTKLEKLSPYKNGKAYSIVYDVQIEHGRKRITLRSPLQVHNHLNFPVELYYQTAALPDVWSTPTPTGVTGGFTRLAVLDSGCVYNVPLLVFYHCKLFVAPAISGYNMTSTGISREDLGQTYKHQFTCKPLDNSGTPLHFKIVYSQEGCSSPGNLSHGTLHLYPPITIHNLLPYDVNYSIKDRVTISNMDIGMHCLKRGEKAAVCEIDQTKAPEICLQLPDYHGTEWQGTLLLTESHDKIKMVSLKTTKKAKKRVIYLGVLMKNSLDLYIYASHWIINNTGLAMQFKGLDSETCYDIGTQPKPLIFTLKKLNDKGSKKNKAQVCVSRCKWSDPYSLDMVGGNGVVTCNSKDSKQKYRFLVDIQMSGNRHTTLVTILPYFTFNNKTPSALQYTEDKGAHWNDLEINKVTAFWPKTDTTNIFVRYKDSNVNSCYPFSLKQFLPTKALSKAASTPGFQHTLLRMQNGTGLVVEVSGGREGPVTVTFSPYESGSAPVRVENLCESVSITFRQKSKRTLLPLLTSVLYTWDDPTADRTLRWGLGLGGRTGPEVPATINEDAHGKQLLQWVDQKDRKVAAVPVYWVSYLDGLQRALLFTDNQQIAQRAQKGCEAERASLSVLLSLSGLRVSLKKDSQVVALVSLTSDPVTWNVKSKDGSKWRPLNPEAAAGIDAMTSNEIKDKLNSNRHMYRRRYHPAVWAHYRHSAHHTFLQGRLQGAHVEDGLQGGTRGGKVLHHPQSGEGTPLVELSLMVRTDTKNDIMTTAVKYCDLSIQEFNLNADFMFCMAICDIFKSDEAEHEGDLTEPDLTVSRCVPNNIADDLPLAEQGRVFFESFHISEVKMQLSLSVKNQGEPFMEKDLDIISSFLVFLGTHVVNIKDAELQMDSFSRHASAHTCCHLLAEIVSHFRSQGKRNLHKLLQGVDLVFITKAFHNIKKFAQGKEYIKRRVAHDPIIGAELWTPEI